MRMFMASGDRTFVAVWATWPSAPTTSPRGIMSPASSRWIVDGLTGVPSLPIFSAICSTVLRPSACSAIWWSSSVTCTKPASSRSMSQGGSTNALSFIWPTGRTPGANCGRSGTGGAAGCWGAPAAAGGWAGWLVGLGAAGALTGRLLQAGPDAPRRGWARRREPNRGGAGTELDALRDRGRLGRDRLGDRPVGQHVERERRVDRRGHVRVHERGLLPLRELAHLLLLDVRAVE